jgi:aldehyde dehydrogenase (NAD+)
MRIARKEIFGAVLSIMPYDSVEQAIERASDTVHGLASYIQTKDVAKARETSRRHCHVREFYLSTARYAHGPQTGKSMAWGAPWVTGADFRAEGGVKAEKM